MKKLIFISLLCAFITSPVLADMMQVKIHDGVGTTNGGEFLDEVLMGPIGIYGEGSDISTFCVERYEYISIGGTYWVTLSDRAHKGGEAEFDILDDKTAWVYTYWLDVLDQNEDNANDVQKAIWYLENEDDGVDNWLVDLAEKAIDDNDWKNTNIMVMSLWNDYSCANGYSGNAQDHLVRVPVPGAILLGLLGLGAAGLKLRKFA